MFIFNSSLSGQPLGPIEKCKKRVDYFALVSWVIVTILGLAFIFLNGISLGFFPVEYTIAIASIGSLFGFWFILLLLGRFRIGLRAFVQILCKECTKDGTDPESTYKQALIDKLDAARDTSCNFASMTTAIIGIIVAIATWQEGARPRHIDTTIFVTTFLLILATIVLIHCVDMCDTALNPRVSVRMLERVRAEAMKYYAIGLFSLIPAMLLGIAVISPYLTPMASISYMLVVPRYFFMWELDNESL